MIQQERSGLNEAAEISAHAAGAVRGAIKTGKMVSSAAKGAAAAGPYGAAAAALWTRRKAVAAIIAGVLVLPVLFIMLLPSLIFGGLTKAGVEGSPDTPILNDNAAVVENINQISQAISDLLEEGQEDVRTRIDADFTASGADQKEIINPYESSPTYNANRFIAMYCAAKNQDYTSISLKDMEDIIRKAKDALYTFTSTEESRTTTVTETNTDPKTGKVTVTETEVTEIWKIYTTVVLDAYAAALREAFPNRPLFIVTGATTTFAKRRALRQTLRESGNGILLCTQQSLPSSVNFEFVNKVIIPELHYNNSRMSQFYMRFIRFNSVDWKDIYFLTYAQSIESNLMQMILAKEKLNLFMKGDETDMDDIYERFGVDYDLTSLLLYRDIDEDGRFSIRWGEQEIA